MRLGSRARARRGTVLVLYAGLFFGLLGIAAAAIDLGAARLTQAQMQSAVDFAAVEGLRAQDPADPSGTAARDAARQAVALQFQDHIDPDTGTRIGYGAGPQYRLQGGLGGELYAAQLVTPDGVYKPDLQPNAGNDPAGDVVTGTFTPTPFEGRAENGDYTRNDGFAPAAGGTSDALLVRLRRSNEPAVDGVSSPGPPLPFLFGRGAMMQPDPKTGYNPRRDGVTVRAAAVAQLVPAKTVGAATTLTGPSGLVTVRGLDPVTIALRWDYLQDHQGSTAPLQDYWRTDTTPRQEVPRALDLAAGGLTVPASDADRLPAGYDRNVGRVVSTTGHARWHIGDVLPEPDAGTPATGPLVYAVLYQEFTTGTGAGAVTTRYVVGFGTVSVDPATPDRVTIGRASDAGPLPPETHRSASAAVLQRPDSTLPADAPLNQLFGTNGALAGLSDAAGRPVALAVPALVR